LWFERNPEKDHGDMTQNITGVKIMRSNLQIKNPPSYTATVQSSELKIDQSVVEVVIIETPCSSREESE